VLVGARVSKGLGRATKALSNGLSLPKSFYFAPEALRILAGDEIPGEAVIIDIALRQERRTRNALIIDCWSSTLSGVQ